MMTFIFLYYVMYETLSAHNPIVPISLSPKNRINLVLRITSILCQRNPIAWTKSVSTHRNTF